MKKKKGLKGVQHLPETVPTIDSFMGHVELPKDEEGLDARALGEDVFSGPQERKKSRAERCRCLCQPHQTHILHTFSFTLQEQVRLVRWAVPVPQIQEHIVDVISLFCF